MLRAILNRSWQQHPTRRQLYGHLPPITKTIQARRTRHAGHCWRSKDEIVSDVLLWTPAYGQSKAGRPARTFIQQLCDDTGCNPEDLPKAMNDRETWRERVRDICASRTSWWWWWTNKAKRTCHLVDFTVPVDHWVKIKENENNWQIFGFYQRAELLARKEQYPRDWKRDWLNGKSKEESRPYRPQPCWDRPEYSEWSRWPEKTCCYSDSCERLQAEDGMKSSQRVEHNTKWYMQTSESVQEN